LGYRIVDGGGALTVLVSANVPTRCRVVGQDGAAVSESEVARQRHEIPGRNGGSYHVELLTGL
jgi:hypothetical protein